MQLSNLELGNYLKSIRENLGYSTHDVNKLCDISQSYLSLMENGKRKPSAIILKKLAPIYNLDYLDLYEKAGYIDLIGKKSTKTESNAFPTADVPIEVPVLGKISAGLPILAVENIEGYEFAPSTYLKSDYEYFYLKVQGDSMNLRFPEGNLVLVQKQDTLEDGEIGVFLIDDQDATVKKYRKDGNFIILDPMSTNPSNITQIYNIKEIPVKIIGKVILHIGKV